MNSKYAAVVAIMAVMLISATALATEDALATKYKGNSQAVAQANECGNGVLAENVGCQNTASQIQGDDNRAALASSQQFEDQ